MNINNNLLVAANSILHSSRSPINSFGPFYNVCTRITIHHLHHLIRLFLLSFRRQLQSPICIISWWTK